MLQGVHGCRSSQGRAMIRIRLSEPDARLLEDEYRGSKVAGHRDRLQIVRPVWRPRIGLITRSPKTWASRPAPCNDGSTATWSMAWPGCSPAGPRGPRRRSRLIWATRSAVGSSRGQPPRGWTGLTGRTPSWPSTCIAPTASGPAGRPCSGIVRSSASGCTGRPTASCGATPRSKRPPAKSWPS